MKLTAAATTWGAAARRLLLTLSLATAGVLAVTVQARATIPAPTTLSYTGGEQSYTTPSNVLVVGVAAQGAWGGQSNNVGQQGAGITGYLTVTPGQTLFAEVGQNGGYDGGATFGGGGAAGAPPPVVCMSNGGPCGGAYASAGGGASDVRTCSIHAASCAGGVSSLGSRLIVGAGGGGDSGGGNASSPTCAGPISGGGIGANQQTNLPSALPGGPAPVITAAGIVIPGFASEVHPSVMTINGTTDAAMGSATAGAGGVLAGCSSGSITFSNSVRGSPGSGPNGGAGGNASGLPPFSGSGCTGTQCADAGPGGGGGGGYFGGGGGATGYDACSCGNAAGGGQGGGGGSSFAANAVHDPRAPGVLANVREVFVKFVPVIEIDVPTNGAVYRPGQVVDASWSCGFDPATALGIPGNNCMATDAPGSAISTTAGTHTFTVHGAVNNHDLSATVTYTVGSSAGQHTTGGAGGLKFTLTAPRTVVAGGKLTVTVARSGKSKSYKAVSYSYSFGGKAVHVASKAGTVRLAVGTLAPGTHTLVVRVKLRSAAKHGHKSKTVTLRLPFTVA